MKRIKFTFMVLFLAAVLAGAGCAASGGTPTKAPGGLVQSNTGGAVTIDVTWLREQTSSVVFRVEMNTHSVNLDRYDLKKLAALRDDQGNEYPPLSWEAPAGGHHRSGRLIFAAPESMKQGRVKSFSVVIRDVAGVAERVLQWELPG